ncbi:MAG: amidohydrolase family protein [Thermodesulfovibrionales bacterium]|nr:amidohydrolase family protein [Thermodesulfovibrionales bacterium]
MNNIIDFHTHAFPDELAKRVIKMLEDEGGVKAHLDGKISSLLSSMDACGIEKSIICNIATKPEQSDSILQWCKKIRSERIVPFPSFHPYDPKFKERVDEIKQEGFKGIKFHPYYQDFIIDDERLCPVYKKICDENLILVMHTGFDFAFSRIKIADPEKIITVIEKFPSLKLITTHLGAWEQWDEVEQFLLGKNIYMEISFSLEFLDDAVRKIFLNHPQEYILFGTDSPWTEQQKTLSLLKGLQLGEKKEALILRENATKLLNSV